MRPPLWPPPVALSTAEHAIIKRIRGAKVCGCLRQHRHARGAEAVQPELLTLSKDQPPGQPPVPPAPGALATLLPASPPVSDDAGSVATTMDRRWPGVRDGRDAEPPPCSPGLLVALRQRVSAQQLDRRWRARTVARAAPSGACGARQWRAALESRPLGGAGRVDETHHLLGHTLRQALSVIARQQGRGLRAVAEEAGAALVWRDRACTRPWRWTGMIPGRRRTR